MMQPHCALCVAKIPQRGGRKAHTTKLLLRSVTFGFLVPEGSAVVGKKACRSTSFWLRELIRLPSESLHWVLLTTEATLQEVRYYELRWCRAATFPKCVKLGTDAYHLGILGSEAITIA
jgi:hypothetical protein